MDTILRYRGRSVSASDVAFITTLLAEQPKRSRRALSFALCEAWQWKQPNGTPCDVVCRGLLLALYRAGHITLPPAKWRSPQPARRRIARAPIVFDTTPIETTLAELGAIEIRQVRRTPEEGVVESLLEQHHYLGYARPIGEHLKYLVTAAGRVLGCFCWSSAARHLGLRDSYLGWEPEVRRRNIGLVAYQTRFLIAPWVRVPHLASHLLGRMSRQLSADWQKVYAHPIYFVETFVDPTRYRGTCYRAANWTYLGLTAGRGNNARTHEATRSFKQLYGYPLIADFRRRLGASS